MNDKAIRAAKLTASGILEKRRAATAVDRAGGQIAPSHYLPGVPRAVHADGGRISKDYGGALGYVPQQWVQQQQQLAVAQPPQPPKQQQSFTMDALTQLAGIASQKPAEKPAETPSAASEGHPPTAGVSASAQAALDALRKGWTGQDFTVVSDYRDPNKNEAVGGAKGSQHLSGNAFDIDTSGWTPEQKLALATQAYQSGFRGYGFYDNNMHFDVGGQRAWGPSYHQDSIPEWAQDWTQRYIYADGGHVVKAGGGEVDDDDQGITAYHGSPHSFDQFDIDKIGTGEGAQAYGHGLYFAGNEAVAKGYRNALSDTLIHPEGTPDLEKRAGQMALTFSDNTPEGAIGWLGKFRNGAKHTSPALTPELIDAVSKRFSSGDFRPGGHMYKVKLNVKPHELLDWDAPVSEQHPTVMQKIQQFFPDGVPATKKYGEMVKGGDLYQMMLDRAGGIMHRPKLDAAGIPSAMPGGTPERLSRYLMSQGIKGIRYRDAGSRNMTDGDPTHNYVMFHHDPVKVVNKYEYGGRVGKAGGGALGDSFKDWFGDSVTHTNGQPHVFYHGTSKDQDFTGFNVGRHGAWFTRNPDVASSYAEQNDSQGYKQDGWNMVRTNTASRVIPAYVKAENPYTGELPPEVMRGNYKKAQSDWFDTLRAKGHDAWMPASAGGNLLVALKEPQQIKSVYNSGKFDPKQKHMGKAGGGEVDGINNNQIGGIENEQTAAGNSQDGTQAFGFPQSGGIRGSEGILSPPLQASGEEDLIGLPKSVSMPKLGQKITAAHDPRIRQVARDYARTSGIDYTAPTAYRKVDPARAKRIADAYEAMPHDPNHPLVKASYDALLRETKGQYDAMKRAGVKLEFYPDINNDPYKSNPRLAVEDIRHNNHMYVYPTDAGYGTGDAMPDADSNPMLRDSGERWNGKPVMFNDLFRAVHDYFGHAKEGVGFRADGEENAWRQHAAMFSPLARIALGTETRGQNSWLNYGPHGDKNRTAATEDTVFAPQKLGVLPPWVHHEGAEDFIKPEERAQMDAIYRQHSKPVSKALELTRRFTKDGNGATLALKSKGN